jgi:serine/threonine protein kinase/ABC-type branched-subunit amino acid transport system substrate-binding protein
MAVADKNVPLVGGRYRLIAQIGRGGMADVYLAVSRSGMGGFQKLLVVKVLRENLVLEDDFLPMFIDEARLAARLNHPNVVQTNEVGEDNGRYFIAMEHLEGQTLHPILKHPKSAQRFSRSMRIRVLTRVLAGLHYAHELRDYDGTPLRIVHRDVSPSNILVTYEGQVKLVDFGIAKAIDSSGQTRMGVFKGKAAYMAPEQITGSCEIDRKVDIYAAGVVLWEMLACARMWKDVTPVDVMRRASQGELPSLRSAAPDVPDDLERICQKALALSPAERYPTAAAMEAELEKHLDGERRAPSDRDVGEAVKTMFADARATLRNAIEAQLRAPEELSAEGLPVISAGTGGSTASNSMASSSSSGSGSAVQAIGEHGPPKPVQASLAVDSGSGRRLPRRRAVWAALAVAPLAIGATVAVFSPLGRSTRGAVAESASATAPRSPASTSRAAAAAPREVRGVTDTEVLLGMSAAFSGPSRELGNRMKLGVETAFDSINARGGIEGRKLRLIALDDGYEGPRAGDNMKELIDTRRVFAVIGNVGTPTAAVAAPYAIAHKTLFFGAFTGAKLLRQEPTDRYVFNYRASYEEETAEMVRYLVDTKRISPASIAVFAQHDSFGDSGFEGVAKTLRKYGRADSDILRVNYERNTVDVDSAVREIIAYHNAADRVRLGGDAGVMFRARHPVKAIIMVATYKPAARFIQKVKDHGVDAVFLNVSFVGSNALADELKELGPSYGPGVIVTQVVPPCDSGGTGVLRYRDALKEFHPDQSPDFVSLEGYVVGTLFGEGLRRAGRDLDTEKLVDTFDSIRDYDMGIGTVLNFGLSQHQASHKVWGTVLDAQGHLQTLDME